MEMKHTQQGFTLLEVMVSVIIIAVVGIVIVQSFFTTTRNNTKAEALKDVKQNGDFAIAVMERMMHNAVGLAMSCPDTGVATQSVAITNADGGTTTFGCVPFTQGNSTYPRLASVSAETNYLTTEGLTLDPNGGSVCAAIAPALFTCKSSTGLTTIDITFSLGKQGNTTQDAQSSLRTFTSTVVLRN